MIRKIRLDDIPRLKELENGFEWSFGVDYIDGLVSVDSEDKPVMFAGAWSRAEVHIALDKNFSTPAVRFALLKELHDAMQAEMKRKGYGQAVTWFAGKVERFQKRLEKWGWVMSNKQSWHRRIT